MSSSKMNGGFTGPDLETIEAGQLYKIVEEDGNYHLELQDATTATCYLRPNVYNLIKDLSQHLYGKDWDDHIELYVGEAIHRMLELNLTGSTKSMEVSKEIAEYLCKKHDFNPAAWREEQ